MPVGDEQFAALYGANVDALFAYACSRTSRDRAAEAVEETFIAAWRRLDELPLEPRPWLFGIARGVLSNQRRAGERQAALHRRLAFAGRGEEVESDPAASVSERDRVQRALTQLSGDDREVLCLSAWGRLSPDEIASVLGCSKATLAVRLHRARRRFAAVLEAADRWSGGDGSALGVRRVEEPGNEQYDRTLSLTFDRWSPDQGDRIVRIVGKQVFG